MCSISRVRAPVVLRANFGAVVLDHVNDADARCCACTDRGSRPTRARGLKHGVNAQ